MYTRIITLLFLFIPATHYGKGVAKEKNCIACHQQQGAQWQTSDHAKAMAVASSETILANFDNASITHYTQKALFYQKNQAYLVKLTEQNHTTEYEIKYTFGHFPLQQYLVKTTGGRFQVLPFAWDSRPMSEGGQKWFANYANEDIQPSDRLHWQQPLQNWNGMCADCHSDGLTRHYDVASDSFNSQWDNINVGCISCHKQTAHPNSHSKVTAITDTLTPETKNQLLQWLRLPNEKVAKLRTTQATSTDLQLASEQAKTENGRFMDSCFSCHALRSPLTDGIHPQTAFLDQFSPALLSQPFYHSDGQIKEEVYVYGSFLQSKMYKAGVTCLDCHDSHSMKLKASGNGLCLQCHSSEEYQQQSHTGHALDSEAGQCVSCHMPETTYMGVDERRDHSFKIPRPDLSQRYNTPNVCINCHTDKDNLWAKNSLEKRHGPAKTLPHGERLFIELMHQGFLPLGQHLKLINDLSLSEIKRASAILLLVNSTQILTDSVVKPWVESNENLIRLATAQVGHLLNTEQKLKSYKLLLADNYKAIRVAAANHVIRIGLQDSTAFNQAFKELIDSTLVSSWRGEGNLNLSQIHTQLNQPTAAIDALQHSIKVDPYFAPSYVNLAEMHRARGNVKREKQVLDTGLENNPNAAEIFYAYGLYQIRSGDKQAAIGLFEKAVKLAPQNAQHAYLYFLALDSVKQTNQAIVGLKQSIYRYKNNASLIQLGLNFSQKMQSREAFDFFTALAQK
ncbi:cytochrome c3 family protein [uncultured Paraglaciecola sp.]|uniref:cytochrome c3 family protein n=1 Tax=uncultured Paraglaciecola sp. TaxID=1765024 RepID=UPI00261087C4|nr:cytochrome c3 family protein [uncultured Paraglaciecola sp.]